MSQDGITAISLRTLQERSIGSLRAAGIDSAALEVRVLLKHVFKVSDADIIVGGDVSATPEQVEGLETLLSRRCAGEPLSLILGVKEFWGLSFTVSADVLDPRPDTETLIEAVLQAYKGKGADARPRTILDLGTGSGCLLITLLKEFPNARGVAVDISRDALLIAKENAKTHGVDSRIRLVNGSWLEGITEKFDLIVSNPPYISTDEIESLAIEVKNHDPILALDGGDDGLICYKDIVTEINKNIYPASKIFFEVGKSQADDVVRIVKNAGLEVAAVHADLGGIPRVVEICTGEK